VPSRRSRRFLGGQICRIDQHIGQDRLVIVLHRLGSRIEEPMPSGAEVAFGGPDNLAARTVLVHVFSWPAAVEVYPEFAGFARDYLPFLVQPVNRKVFSLYKRGKLIIVDARFEHMDPFDQLGAALRIGRMINKIQPWIGGTFPFRTNVPDHQDQHVVIDSQDRHMVRCQLAPNTNAFNVLVLAALPRQRLK
jgi:hypothetical protein